MLDEVSNNNAGKSQVARKRDKFWVGWWWGMKGLEWCSNNNDGVWGEEETWQLSLVNRRAERGNIQQLSAILHPTNQLTNQPTIPHLTNRPYNQLKTNHQLTKHPASNQPTDKPSSQPSCIKPTTIKPTNQLTNQPSNRSTNQKTKLAIVRIFF